ncbi:MAG TPA: biopolymer transporter ExbD [Phycisphaerae bacterium]|nr:biopolymer transporter ExbD [Phycisphaerae bacterium]
MRRRSIDPMHDEHVNVTPLIDVMMCLIIFFLVCGKLAAQESNDKVIVPRAELGQQLPEQRDRLLINVVPRGSEQTVATEEPLVYVRGGEIAMNDLAKYLRDEKGKTPDVKVIIRADRNIPYQWIAPVLTACAQAGIKSVNFSTLHLDEH